MIIALMLLCTIPSPELWARGDGEPKEKSHKSMMMHKVKHLQEKLDLSEDQVTAIKAINAQKKNAYKKALDVLEPSREKIHQLTLREPIDYAAIRQVMEASSATHIDMRINHIRHRQAIRTVLTPAQREKFDKLVKKHKKFRKGHHHKKFGRQHRDH